MVIKAKNTKQKKQENKKIKNIKSSGSKKSSTTNNLALVFDKHVNCEFENKDVYATMQTMTKEPYVYHIPVLTGGKGYDEVYTFFSKQ